MIDYFLPIVLFTLTDISYASWSAYASDCLLLFPIHCVKRYRVFVKLWDMLVVGFRQYTYVFDKSQVKMFIFEIKNSLDHCDNTKRMRLRVKDRFFAFPSFTSNWFDRKLTQFDVVKANPILRFYLRHAFFFDKKILSIIHFPDEA